jgi:hypothetical protein
MSNTDWPSNSVTDVIARYKKAIVAFEVSFAGAVSEAITLGLLHGTAEKVATIAVGFGTALVTALGVRQAPKNAEPSQDADI